MSRGSKNSSEFWDNVASVVDGDAQASLYEAIADDDTLRDQRHQVESLCRALKTAGSDFQPVRDLEQRLEVRLKKLQQEPTPKRPLSERSIARSSRVAPRTVDATSPGALSRSWDWFRKSPVRMGVALALVAAGTLLVVGRRGSDAPSVASGDAWVGKVVWQESPDGKEGGLEVCDAEERCKNAVASSRVAEGSRIRTARATRAELELGSDLRLVLERSTEVQLLKDEPGARLIKGALVLESDEHQANVSLLVPHGRITLLGTKLAVRTHEGATTVDVSRGSVRITDNDDRTAVIHAGETGRLVRDGRPMVSTNTSLGEALVWAERAPRRKEIAPTRGLGELTAKKPGNDKELEGAVKLVRHATKIRISGAVARTEVEEVFENSTDSVLEGILRFPLPPGAKIERLALEVDGKLEEGAFVDRERAKGIWRGTLVNAEPKLRQQIKEEIIWVPGPWKDPALLEWQRGGRFELRIFPIPKRGSRRVVIAYTETVGPSGSVRRFNYPLPYDPSGSTRVGHATFDVEVRGHDADVGVRHAGYELNAREEGNVAKLSASFDDFHPSGDLTIEYALPGGARELTTWAYEGSFGRGQADKEAAVGGVERFAALALNPTLPRNEERSERAFAIVVDRSRSMFGENYRRATHLVARLIEELDPDDTLGVLACDVQCEEIVAGGQPPSSELAQTVYERMDRQTPDGGSNLVEALRTATRQLEKTDRRRTIVLLSDGTPTVGAIRPGYVKTSLTKRLRDSGTEVIAVAIGPDSDTQLLSAAVRPGGGVVLPFLPGQSAADAAFRVLGASYAPKLRNVELTLPEGLSEVAPRKLETMLSGSEEIVVARMQKPHVTGELRVRGEIAGKPFEKSYPIDLRAQSNSANAFVPRLFAAQRIKDLEQYEGESAKEQAIRLSQRFSVASRHTSLLVLESPAMFRAFGLDNQRVAPVWSAEADAEETAIYKDEDAGDEVASTEREAMGRGSSGSPYGSADSYGGLGRASAAPSRPRSAPKAKAARKPRPASPLTDEAADLAEPLEMDPGPPFALPPSPPPRRMIPMRKVWDRKGSIDTGSLSSSIATADSIFKAEQALEQDTNNKTRLKELYVLYTLAHRDEDALRLAERWAEKEPLDPEALTARADSAARAGRRDEAIRILSGVVDVRPDDVKAQKRLARLHRWAGRPELGCGHAFAIAQLTPGDIDLAAEAVRCLRSEGQQEVADQFLFEQPEAKRAQIESSLKQEEKRAALKGDLTARANWNGGADLDIAILHPDGHRVSWLGAPTRSLISATDVTSPSQEGLALSGAKPGEYLVEIVRASGSGPVSGTLELDVAGTRRSISFTLSDQRTTVARAKVYMQSRLVPL